MNCPNCQNPTISFFQYIKGRNAFTWECPECGAHLRAGFGTWLLVVSGFVVALGILFLFSYKSTVLGLQTDSKGFVAVVAVFVYLVVAALGYRFAGYIVQRR